jgi:hypothetical protein
MPGMPKGTQAHVEAYLEENGRSTRTLLTAFMMHEQPHYLEAALLLGQDDPLLIGEVEALERRLPRSLSR